MATAEFELSLYKLLDQLRTKLEPTRDTEQAARSATRDIRAFFEADAVCLAEFEPAAAQLKLSYTLPTDTVWDLDFIAAFYNRRRLPIRDDIMLAPLYRRERRWRVLALHRKDRPFSHDEREALSRLAGTTSRLLGRIDRDRIAEVRSRIDRKIMEQLRPRDLFYQILHGLRKLTGYDHSAALLIVVEGGGALRVVAEQIAWQKGKSTQIGCALNLDPDLYKLMSDGAIHGFERQGQGWTEWTDHDTTALADLLDYNPVDAENAIRESSLLCAPLVTRDGLMGVLKVASFRPGGLGEYERKLVERFMVQVAVAMQNSRRTETLQAKMLDVEKRNAMADLARGVAHDLNNALGSILPLIQQLEADVEEGSIDPKLLGEDLKEIKRSLQVCRRIFSGMLAFARGTTRNQHRGSIGEAAQSALSILRDGLKRRAIEWELVIEDGLPAVRGGQTDLEQVMFNLMTNARDAMPEGGTITVRAGLVDNMVKVAVEDTGIGIPEENLTKIQEPFFSTKPQGSGLGISICRSLLWGMNGEFSIRNRAGAGTRVEFSLPCEDKLQPEGED